MLRQTVPFQQLFQDRPLALKKNGTNEKVVHKAGKSDKGLQSEVESSRSSDSTT
jgi:hypothetical protein